jgi:hypothetical protein
VLMFVEGVAEEVQCSTASLSREALRKRCRYVECMHRVKSCSTAVGVLYQCVSGDLTSALFALV